MAKKGKSEPLFVKSKVREFIKGKGCNTSSAILDGDAFWTKNGASNCNYFELMRGLGHEYYIMEDRRVLTNFLIFHGRFPFLR